MSERVYTNVEENINTISKTAGKYPQDSYAAVVRTIQSEWIFLQRITWDTGDAFTGVEKMIQETFLPHLFFIKSKTVSPIVGTDQGVQTQPPESSEIRKEKIPKLPARKRGTD